jgi:hypothetical protein
VLAFVGAVAFAVFGSMDKDALPWNKKKEIPDGSRKAVETKNSSKTPSRRLREALNGYTAPDGTRFRIDEGMMTYASAAKLFPAGGVGGQSWEIVALDVQNRLGQWVPTVYAPVIVGDLEGIRKIVKTFHEEYVNTAAFTEMPPSVNGTWKFAPYRRTNDKRENYLIFKMDGMKTMSVNGESVITSDLGDHRDAVVAALQYNRSKGGLNKIEGANYWKSIEQMASQHNQMDELEREILYADIQWNKEQDQKKLES